MLIFVKTPTSPIFTMQFSDTKMPFRGKNNKKEAKNIHTNKNLCIFRYIFKVFSLKKFQDFSRKIDFLCFLKKNVVFFDELRVLGTEW